MDLPFQTLPCQLYVYAQIVPSTQLTLTDFSPLTSHWNCICPNCFKMFGTSWARLLTTPVEKPWCALDKHQGNANRLSTIASWTCGQVEIATKPVPYWKLSAKIWPSKPNISMGDSYDTRSCRRPHQTSSHCHGLAVEFYLKNGGQWITGGFTIH